ncbi:MAG TPA: AAA family ATPase [Rhodospirillaceae bacterium]|nr:AAA family ATPase [Rhodospirillaceae bacterium]
MYRDFFRLSDEPFRVTPDPGFLFLADQYKQALAAIAQGIARRKGFVCITGEVGVGKTTILRAYLDGIKEGLPTFVYVYNPKVSFPALLRGILGDLHLPAAGDLPQMVERLRGHLLACHRNRSTVVLFIDEAQTMPIETLEGLRLLSNLETATEKLLQIILVGQPELDDLLATPQLRPLHSRIVLRARLRPLSKADSLAYIRHRLSRVALDKQDIFTRAAIDLLVKEAGGVPRLINILCDAALTTSFRYRLRPVPRQVAREAIEDRFGRRLGHPWRLRLAAGGLAAGLLGALALSGTLGPRTPSFSAPTAMPPALQIPPPAVRPPKPPEPPEPVADPPPPEPIPQPATFPPAAKPPESQRTVIVKRGDTLSRLSLALFGSADSRRLMRLRQANPTLTNVNRLYPGQIIAVPAEESDR